MPDASHAGPFGPRFPVRPLDRAVTASNLDAAYAAARVAACELALVHEAARDWIARHACGGDGDGDLPHAFPVSAATFAVSYMRKRDRGFLDLIRDALPALTACSLPQVPKPLRRTGNTYAAWVLNLHMNTALIAAELAPELVGAADRLLVELQPPGAADWEPFNGWPLVDHYDRLAPVAARAPAGELAAGLAELCYPRSPNRVLLGLEAEFARATAFRVAYGLPTVGVGPCADKANAGSGGADAGIQAAPQTEPADDGGTDPTAYRPAKEFLDTRYTTAKRVRGVLKANRWIRWHKPSRQRLEIHAGDWRKFLCKQADAEFEQLDASPEVAAAAVARAKERLDEIDRRKAFR
jgi:hypothetical protein